ncbi:uncharacterized protein [Nicotiana sylvestris]|uniref:uncharacterized protein n=1 Tax=Nicotiana sylvestris TaxID=4096 RepID=UPI00388C433B
MDVIGQIEPTASNEHRFILVVIDYLSKWVEAAFYKALTKKVIADFVKDLSISTGATPYMLVYGTEAVIPTEVEIPSWRIIQEAELSDAEWIRNRYEKLALIDGKRMNAVCHGQLCQNKMSRSFNKRVKPRQFALGQLVLKKIFPHQDEAKGKFSPNWQGPYMVHRVIIGGALIIAEMDREI